MKTLPWASRLSQLWLWLCVASAVAGCGQSVGGAPGVGVPGVEGAVKSTASVRAERRLFDGAPPVIAHRDFGADCVSCHTMTGMSVPGTGFAPPAPHVDVKPPAAMSRCQQCHPWKVAADEFQPNDFVGLRQDLRQGRRLNDLAPPVIPHQTLLRENCQACHTGPAAREEVRTPHPERVRCVQCHAAQTTVLDFER